MKVPVDFTSQAYFRNPAAGLARLRAAGPVLEVKFPIVGRVWIATTQELAGRVLKDSETFSLRKNGGDAREPALVDAGHRWRARQQHADHGRAGPHPVAQHRRRSLSPPRHPRFGAAHSGHRRRAGRRPVCARQPRRPRRPIRAPAAVVRHLRGARPAAGRQTEVHGLDEQLHAPDGRPRPLGPHSCGRGDAALPGIATRDRAPAWRRRPDRRAGPGREGRRAHLRQRDGVDGLSAAGRRDGDDHAFDQRIGPRADAKSEPARLARSRLGPRQPGDRGVSALPLARAVLQAALRAARCGARRRGAEEGRQDHGHAGGRQHGPRRQ